MMENFFSLLKSELLYLQDFKSVEDFEEQLRGALWKALLAVPDACSNKNLLSPAQTHGFAPDSERAAIELGETRSTRKKTPDITSEVFHNSNLKFNL